MHDPDVMLFSVRYPWWHKYADRRYHPPFVTVWHHEPMERDSGSVCKREYASRTKWGNFKFSVTHLRHWQIQVHPYQRVHSWLFDRCSECGFRFLWKQPKTGWMSSDDSMHYPCMNFVTTRGQLDDLTKFVHFELDDKNAMWRAEYRLKHLDTAAPLHDTKEKE